MVNMFTVLLILYGALFALLAWKRFTTAALLLITTLPSYLIRFNVFGRPQLPTTLLELMFGILFCVWLVRYSKEDSKTLYVTTKRHPWFSLGLILFFVASISSIFVSDMIIASLGQWRAYFFEPLLFIGIIIGRGITFNEATLGLTIGSLSVSTVGIIQKFNHNWYPPSLWDDQLFGRVTSFFTSPNDVGLFLAPLIPLAIYHAIRKDAPKWTKVSAASAALLDVVAIIFSKSLGAWIALFIGIVLYIWLYASKKIASTIVLLAILSTLFPPIHSVLQSKNKSGGNRIVLWSYSWDYLSASPKNFIFGTGIRQFFRKIQKPHYDPTKMERLIYPHNVFLNFWTEIGLFGMIGFTISFAYALWISYRNTNTLVRASLLSALIILVVHGLVDVPYFKNDLAFLYCTLLTLPFLHKSRLS